MDGDIFGDTLVDDLLALSGAGGDFDTSDLMDILEPDYLENNILLDNTGSLTSLGDVAAFDDLGNFDDAPTPTADVHASFDAAVRTKAQEESNNPDVNSPDVNGQNDMPQATPAKSAARASQARATPELTTRQAQAATDEDEEDDTPEDPLEDVTSGMLPEDDLEALARLAAGEDEFPDDASDGFGLSAPAADPLETDTLEGGVNLDASDVMGTSAMSTSAMSTSMDEAAPSSGKNLLDDTLDERTQPNMDELEELALLASGGTDLGSVLMDEESQEDGSQEDGSQEARALKHRARQAPKQRHLRTPHHNLELNLNGLNLNELNLKELNLNELNLNELNLNELNLNELNLKGLNLKAKRQTRAIKITSKKPTQRFKLVPIKMLHQRCLPDVFRRSLLHGHRRHRRHRRHKAPRAVASYQLLHLLMSAQHWPHPQRNWFATTARPISCGVTLTQALCSRQLIASKTSLIFLRFLWWCFWDAPPNVTSSTSPTMTT